MCCRWNLTTKRFKDINGFMSILHNDEIFLYFHCNTVIYWWINGVQKESPLKPNEKLYNNNHKTIVLKKKTSRLNDIICSIYKKKIRKIPFSLTGLYFYKFPLDIYTYLKISREKERIRWLSSNLLNTPGSIIR